MPFQCCTYIVLQSLLSRSISSQEKNTILTSLHSSFLALIFSPPALFEKAPSLLLLLLVRSGLVTMMSTQTSSRRNCHTGFPGDPRYTAMRLTATAAEFACLSGEEFLSTAVLDCILQSTALPQDVTSEGKNPPMIGSLGCEAWMLSCNATASLTREAVATQSEWKQHQYVLTKHRNMLARIIDVKATPDLPQRLIIPMVSPPNLPGHFFVACFDFSVHHP